MISSDKEVGLAAAAAAIALWFTAPHLSHCLTHPWEVSAIMLASAPLVASVTLPAVERQPAWSWPINPSSRVVKFRQKEKQLGFQARRQFGAARFCSCGTRPCLSFLQVLFYAVLDILAKIAFGTVIFIKHNIVASA